MLEPAKSSLMTMGLDHSLDMMGIRFDGTSIDLLIASPTPAALAAFKSSGVTIVDMPLGSVGEFRSEERRVGNECVSTCRSRWSPDHYNKKIITLLTSSTSYSSV